MNKIQPVYQASEYSCESENARGRQIKMREKANSFCRIEIQGPDLLPACSLEVVFALPDPFLTARLTTRVLLYIS